MSGAPSRRVGRNKREDSQDSLQLPACSLQEPAQKHAHRHALFVVRERLSVVVFSGTVLRTWLLSLASSLRGVEIVWGTISNEAIQGRCCGKQYARLAQARPHTKFTTARSEFAGSIVYLVCG